MSEGTRTVTINLSRLHFRLKRLKGLEDLTEKDFRDFKFSTKQRVYTELFVRVGVKSVKNFISDNNLERVRKQITN